MSLPLNEEGREELWTVLDEVHEHIAHLVKGRPQPPYLHFLAIDVKSALTIVKAIMHDQQDQLDELRQLLINKPEGG